MNPETINIAGEEVTIDVKHLEFNEDTLSEYFCKEGGYYDYFGGQLARAERYLMLCEKQVDDIFSTQFAILKDTKGGSDVLTTARVKSDPDYQKARDLVIEAKYRVTRLKNHLKSWDKNHDNAQSTGHMVRKSMEKLGTDIRLANGDVVHAWQPWQHEVEDRRRGEEANNMVGYIDDQPESPTE